jgi:hypothetical protein
VVAVAVAKAQRRRWQRRAAGSWPVCAAGRARLSIRGGLFGPGSSVGAPSPADRCCSKNGHFKRWALWFEVCSVSDLPSPGRWPDPGGFCAQLRLRIVPCPHLQLHLALRLDPRRRRGRRCAISQWTLRHLGSTTRTRSSMQERPQGCITPLHASRRPRVLAVGGGLCHVVHTSLMVLCCDACRSCYTL